MIRRAIEGRITWFANLALADLPPLPDGISLHARENELGIEVDGLVGAMPLRNGDTLHIVPKIGPVNFLRLLFKAEGSQDDLAREYEDFVAYTLSDQETVETLVARQLLLAADEIMRRSPLFGHVTRRRRGVFAEGSLDVTATALGTAQRARDPVTFFASERTRDIPENRILTEALSRSWALVIEADRAQFRGVYDLWMNRFPRSSNLSRDLQEIEQGFATGRYGGGRDYYRKALMLAQVVLGSAGLGFSEGAALYGDAVLLNSSAVFERYVRNCISEAYASSDHVVSKGGATHSASLYVDGSFAMNPDIVIEKKSKVVLIADTKYKDPSADDHYQMSAYLSAFEVKTGILLIAFEGAELAKRSFRTSTGRTVWEIYLPLRKLEATEAFLAEVVELA